MFICFYIYHFILLAKITRDFNMRLLSNKIRNFYVLSLIRIQCFCSDCWTVSSVS
jgi:hypothetical protein